MTYPERNLAGGIRISQPDRSSAHAPERLTVTLPAPEDMSSGQNSGGLMSSAGLVRYFDSEDRNAPTIDPRTVVAFGILFGALIQILNAVA